jgi:TolB-like protein/Tfp pilus assembly protein PilF
MPSDHSSDIKFEIGHVLFIDIVGYSKLLITEQSDQLQTLKEIVRGTEQFRLAEAEGKLLRLPTGDGGALVFRTTPEAPVLCAHEISKALKNHPDLRVRMGIHSGPVNEISDLNEQANIAGAGINIAQRVMDCGDAGHILLSKHVADDLEQYPRWRAYLHDLGECEVKHGVRIGLANLYDGEIGNAQLPKKLQAAKRHHAHVRWAAVAIGLLVVAALAALVLSFLRKGPARSLATAVEKSIAVLPFENLSSDKENAYFAEGIQAEILTRLSKIADLKVISQTSTQHYKSAPENVPEIAKQLGVAHILEGSVQKSGSNVRVNVQLIKAANDSHLWADTFDRKLADIFSVESEVAKAIAEQLRVHLTGREAQAITAKSTNNPLAYDAYLRGLAYSFRPGGWSADSLNAIKYYGEAVKLDPKFALAWSWLARESADAYFNKTGDNLSALREAAKHAARVAVELRPDLGEGYLAEGYSQYYCERDYHSAIQLFEKAQELLPGDAQPRLALALVCRRLGEWQRSLDYFRQAVELDPRNPSLLSEQVDMLVMLRQYRAALKTSDQVLDILPENQEVLAQKAAIYLEQGNLASAGELLSPLHSRPGFYHFPYQIRQWIYERRYSQAIAAIKAALEAGLDPETDEYDKINLEANLAWLQQFAGDDAAAKATWRQVRSESENLLREKQEQIAFELASAYMALGEEAKAFAIVERAAAVVSANKDALAAAVIPDMRARVAVQAGKKDLALEQLAISAEGPIGVSTYGDLKLNPLWDPLRGDPRFEKIVASLATSDTK